MNFWTRSEKNCKIKILTGSPNCATRPRYWSKAVPQLVLFALNKKEQSMSRLRRSLAETFEREILADLEYRMSWVGTIVKSAPMLGLLGTVIGMISAFQQLDLAAKRRWRRGRTTCRRDQRGAVHHGGRIGGGHSAGACRRVDQRPHRPFAGRRPALDRRIPGRLRGGSHQCGRAGQLRRRRSVLRR